MNNVSTDREYPQFSPQCFWDMDYNKLDFETDKNFIIARVVSRGGSNDELELFKFYGCDTIRQEIMKIRYLNKKILNYLSSLFDIPKESFSCFANRSIF
jgi:hypothetical protein